MGRTARRIIRRAENESGQSLILIIGAMVVVFVIAALAIDTAMWYQKHHQAQVVADAAALAAANCLADTGQTLATTPVTVTDQCTTSTDAADAQTVATSIAAKNNLTLPTSDVDVNTTSSSDAAGCPAKTVCVTAPNPAPTFFARVAGIRSVSTSAIAGASWTSSLTTPCTSVGGKTCAAVFAMDSGCASPDGITFNGASDTIDGSIWSNGNIDLTQGRGQNVTGSAFYGKSCSTPSTAGQTVTPVPVSTQSTFPKDYRTDFPACTSGCNSDGTPTWCTQHAANFNTLTSSAIKSNQVYCAYGTSKTPGNPATWNGNITFGGGIGSSTNPVPDTFVAGVIDVGVKNTYLTAFSDGLLFYATGGSATLADGTQGSGTTLSCGGETTTICITTQSNLLDGSLFSPFGMIQFDGNGTTSDNFLEGYDIYFVGQDQTVEATGSTLSASGSTTGSDQLVQ